VRICSIRVWARSGSPSRFSRCANFEITSTSAKHSIERCRFITETQTGRKKVKKIMKMARTGGTEGHEKGDYIKTPDDLL